MKDILFFSKEKSNPAGRSLLQIIESVVEDRSLEVLGTVEALSKRLKLLSHRIAVAVLFASSNEELSEFVSLSELFEGVLIILVLPNRRKETISKGHLLHPRFLTYADSDFEEVKAVLDKMINNVAPKQERTCC